MADFTATDYFSEIVMAPNTERGRQWAQTNVTVLGAHRGNGSFAAAPGYMINTVLPELRAAGLTVDGDIDSEGRAMIRVRA